MALDSLGELLDAQRGMLSRAQALERLSEGVLRGRLASSWQVVFPGVYAAFRGPLTEQQRLWAAYLYCGPDMQITDRQVLVDHDLNYLPDEDPDLVHALVPWEQTRKPGSFLKITRTRYMDAPSRLGDLPAAPLARALIDFGLRMSDERVVLGVFADAVQRRKASVGELEKALATAPRRGITQPALAIEALRAGIRSVPENDFRLAARGVRTGPVLYNCLLQLPSGRLISPDALLEECGLVHESNGRLAHAEEDLFESMQERHDVMTTAGLTVLHNSPRRIRHDAKLVAVEWEQNARRLRGCGLPPGVVILRRGPEN